MDTVLHTSLFQFALSRIKEPFCLTTQEGHILQSNMPFQQTISADFTDEPYTHIQDAHLIDIHGMPMEWNLFFQECKRSGQTYQRLGIKQYQSLKFFQVETHYYQHDEDEYLCLFILPRTPNEYADEVDEQHLLSVMDHFPVILCAWDELRNFRFWNLECERILGYTKQDMIGNPDGMTLLYPDPQKRKHIIDRWASCQKQNYQRIRNWELEVTCKNGQTRTISWTIQQEEEPFIGFSTWGIGIDITDNIQLYKQLEASENRFSAISKATNDAVWDWNLLTNELYWNDGLTNLFGHSDANIENSIQWWEAHIHPDDHDRVVKRIYDFVERGEAFWWDEYQFRRQDGSYAFVYDKGHIIQDASGKAVRMIGGILDITERKIYEQNLVLKNHQLAEYIFHNSHKVRAPLARLLGLAYLLNEHYPTLDETKEMIEKIKTAADEIDRMTRHISHVML